MGEIKLLRKKLNYGRQEKKEEEDKMTLSQNKSH